MTDKNENSPTLFPFEDLSGDTQASAVDGLNLPEQTDSDDVWQYDPFVDPYREQKAAAGRVADLRGDDLGAEQGHASPYSPTLPYKPKVGDTMDASGKIRPLEMPRSDRRQRTPGSGPITGSEMAKAWEGRSPAERARASSNLGELVALANNLAKKHRDSVDSAAHNRMVAIEKRRKNAFSRVIDLDRFGIEPEYVHDATPKDFENIDFADLGKLLYRGKNGQKDVIDEVIVGVDEKRLMVDNPELKLANITDTTERRLAAGLGNPEDVDGRDVQRVVAIAMLSRLENMRALAELIASEKDLHVAAKSLVNAVERPDSGAAQIDEEVAFEIAKREVDGLQKIISLIGRHYGWTSEKVVGANKALLSKLLTGDEDEKKENWMEAINFFEKYTKNIGTSLINRSTRMVELMRRNGMDTTPKIQKP